ncbi:helix-turn-helix domain-containing protein [Methylobacterium sp. E-005]|uniref:helix-turn-helix domain-containing protein n=1 Tax=Methylobacterium sp. E-005 TaxID=2836549 RepID=UPI001FBBC110|nr:helix-turn-helix domain-containing protein [Methylobacterium sp. E-005]MCJ2087898.1 helix-turn-helix domain-containing protein [Methylobacterium sp. E-005]
MQPLFSTEGLHPRIAFRQWREMISDQTVPTEIQNLDAAPFHGRIEFAGIGSLPITRSVQSSTRAEVTPEAVRRSGGDRLYAAFTQSGRHTVQQNGREAVCRTGDFVVFDHRPGVSAIETGSFLVLDLPRERLENVLGPSHLFTALAVEANLASTTLASTYVQELIRVGDRLSPDSAARMASIGIDLVVAGLAERIAQEVPRSVHGNATVQRAKAYVEAHSGDATLDPPQLAAAVGVSLRRLQELFHERGRHISDYIWERRLAAAARRLADPACAHLSVGMLAYGCGFSSQAHFARRFKDRYGTTPREYRQVHGLGVQPTVSADTPSSKAAE